MTLQLDPLVSNPVLRALPSLKMLQMIPTFDLLLNPPMALGVTQLD